MTMLNAAHTAQVRFNEGGGTTDRFQRLVKQLSDALGPSSGIDSNDVDADQLLELMRTYQSNRLEWGPYAFQDITRNYTRNLVDEGNGKSNLLVLVWNPGKSSPIHDHANAHCIMKILAGTLEETLYKMPCPGSQCPPSVTKKTVYGENEVTYVSDKIGVHKITNPSPDKVAVSLHLYTPPHAAHYGFNLFDEKNGQAMRIRQAGFFSTRGKICDRSSNGCL